MLAVGVDVSAQMSPCVLGALLALHSKVGVGYVLELANWSALSFVTSYD